MGDFLIDVRSLNPHVVDLQSLSNNLGNVFEPIYQMRNNLSLPAHSVVHISAQLQGILNSCENNKCNLNGITIGLEQIIATYLQTEQTLINPAITISKDELQESEGGHIAVDSDVKNEIIDDTPDIREQGLDYILDALEQMVFGNFSDESNLLGIVGSVLIGCTPIGLVADVRDIIADVYHLFDDDAETSEWITLGIDVVAIIPLADLLKHADKLDEVGETIGNLVDYARGTWKYVDDVITKVDDIIQEGAQKAVDAFQELSDKTQRKILKKLKTIGNLWTKNIGAENLGAVVTDIFTEITEDKVVQFAADTIDGAVDFATDRIEDAVDLASDTVRVVSDFAEDARDVISEWLPW